mmetsp:Transcript_18682/g.29698  ORF Transcript_18682/g.29698 Transcript_18682/m.29698 type:complete len:101 (-) Transcript_18682:600-902(-)
MAMLPELFETPLKSLRVVFFADDADPWGKESSMDSERRLNLEERDLFRIGVLGGCASSDSAREKSFFLLDLRSVFDLLSERPSSTLRINAANSIERFVSS